MIKKKEMCSYSKKITVDAKSSLPVSFSQGNPVTHFFYVLPEMAYAYASSVFEYVSH